MMKRQRFDRILEILGFTKGSELASALGLTRKSSSHCRQNGVPESRLGDLMRLTRERGRDPMEMLEPVCSPVPAKHSQGRAAQMARGDIAASNTERQDDRYVRFRSGGRPMVLKRQPNTRQEALHFRHLLEPPHDPPR